MGKRHEISGPHESPASEPGALDGFEVRCSCGFIGGSTFESMARAAAIAHLDWARRVVPV